MKKSIGKKIYNKIEQLLPIKEVLLEMVIEKLFGHSKNLQTIKNFGI